MKRHLVALFKCVDGKYRTSNVALCGQLVGWRTINPARVDCGSCLRSRAWPAALATNAAAPRDMIET